MGTKVICKLFVDLKAGSQCHRCKKEKEQLEKFSLRRTLISMAMLTFSMSCPSSDFR